MCLNVRRQWLREVKQKAEQRAQNARCNPINQSIKSVLSAWIVRDLNRIQLILDSHSQYIQTHKNRDQVTTFIQRELQQLAPQIWSKSALNVMPLMWFDVLLINHITPFFYFIKHLESRLGFTWLFRSDRLSVWVHAAATPFPCRIDIGTVLRSFSGQWTYD